MFVGTVTTNMQYTLTVGLYQFRLPWLEYLNLKLLSNMKHTKINPSYGILDFSSGLNRKHYLKVL